MLTHIFDSAEAESYVRRHEYGLYLGKNAHTLPPIEEIRGQLSSATPKRRILGCPDRQSQVLWSPLSPCSNNPGVPLLQERSSGFSSSTLNLTGLQLKRHNFTSSSLTYAMVLRQNRELLLKLRHIL